MQTSDEARVLVGSDGLQERISQIGHLEIGALTKTLNQLQQR